MKLLPSYCVSAEYAIVQDGLNSCAKMMKGGFQT